MARLNPAKLHVRYAEGYPLLDASWPRAYTLTHSDSTGDLFLTIGPDFDRSQISGLYTRLMRDEVLAVWRTAESGPELHVYCHVSGGLVIGSAGWRYRIFQRHMAQVLQALRYGDRELFKHEPARDQAQIFVHFTARQVQFNRVEAWGVCGDYQIELA